MRPKQRQTDRGRGRGREEISKKLTKRVRSSDEKRNHENVTIMIVIVKSREIARSG